MVDRGSHHGSAADLGPQLQWDRRLEVLPGLFVQETQWGI
jgi:hypothetical protein